MTETAEKLASEIRSLTDIAKLKLVDAILTDLDAISGQGGGLNSGK